MKKRIFLTESDLHQIVNESVATLLREYGYNQFSDQDFASDGNPYGLEGEEENSSLDGDYFSFNNVWIKIRQDGTPNPVIIVGSKHNRSEKKIQGHEAQRLLDIIRQEAQTKYKGSIHTAMYANLYKLAI